MVVVVAVVLPFAHSHPSLHSLRSPPCRPSHEASAESRAPPLTRLTSPALEPLSLSPFTSADAASLSSFLCRLNERQRL